MEDEIKTILFFNFLIGFQKGLLRAINKDEQVPKTYLTGREVLVNHYQNFMKLLCVLTAGRVRRGGRLKGKKWKFII